MKAPPSLIVAGHLLTLPTGYITVNFYIETSFALLFSDLAVLSKIAKEIIAFCHTI